MKNEIILNEDQRKAVQETDTKPLLIKGCAGSGKSITALKRAESIVNSLRLDGPSAVIIFTYNKTLVNYLKSLTLTHDSKDSNSKLFITNYHHWAYGFIKKYLGYNPQMMDNKIQKSIIEEAKLHSKFDNNKVKQLREEFFIDEFSYIKSYQISKEDYLNNPRKGMGSDKRFTPFDKDCIWELLNNYNSLLGENGLMDFDDLSLTIFEYMNSSNYFRQPFRNVIIDEAQDFTPSQLKVLSSLAANHITLFADGAQRIYQSGLSWKKVGINIVGRSYELTQNYRNNANIVRAATSMIEKDSDNQEYSKNNPLISFGNKPIMVKTKNMEEQLQFIAGEINRLNLAGKSVAILTRDKNCYKQIENKLSKLTGFRVSNISNGKNINAISDNSIKLSTIHSAKGLEFDYVFLLNTSDYNYTYYTKGMDTEDALALERRLLYTGMTRAKEVLYMSYVGEVSRFIKDIDDNLLDRKEIGTYSFTHKLTA